MPLKEKHVFKASEVLIRLYKAFRKRKNPCIIEFIFSIVLQLFKIFLKHEETVMTRENPRMTLIAWQI